MKTKAIIVPRVYNTYSWYQEYILLIASLIQIAGRLTAAVPWWVYLYTLAPSVN